MTDNHIDNTPKTSVNKDKLEHIDIRVLAKDLLLRHTINEAVVCSARVSGGQLCAFLLRTGGVLPTRRDGSYTFCGNIFVRNGL